MRRPSVSSVVRLPPTGFWLFVPILWLLAAGCGRRESPVAAGIRDQVLHLGNGAEPQDLDPQIIAAYTDYNIVIALFEGLAAIDEKTSQGVPAAAERWTISPDGLG